MLSATVIIDSNSKTVKQASIKCFLLVRVALVIAYLIAIEHELTQETLKNKIELSHFFLGAHIAKEGSSEGSR